MSEMTSGEIVSRLRAEQDKIERDYRARIVGIFGSRARGDDREDSDLDVLVEFGEQASYIHLLDLEEFLATQFGCKVEVCSTRSLRKEIAPSVQAELVRL